MRGHTSVPLHSLGLVPVSVPPTSLMPPMLSRSSDLVDWVRPREATSVGRVSTEPAPTPVPAPRSTGDAAVLTRSRAELAAALAADPPVTVPVPGVHRATLASPALGAAALALDLKETVS